MLGRAAERRWRPEAVRSPRARDAAAG